MDINDYIQMLQTTPGVFEQAEAVDFDGTDDIRKSIANTGAADHKTLTCSAWFYEDHEATTRYILSLDAANIRFYLRTNAGKIYIGGYNSASTILFSVTIEADYVPQNTWNHIVVSLDLTSSSRRHIYLNGEAATATWSGTYTNDYIEADTRSSIASRLGSSNWVGRLAHVFYDYNYRDLSVESTLRQFITADGKPVPTEEIGGKGLIGIGSFDKITPNFSGLGFDGTTDYLSRGSDLIGNTDGKTFTFSAFCYFELGSSSTQRIFASDTGGAQQFEIFLIDNKIRVIGSNVSGTRILNIESTATVLYGRFIHVLISIDMSSSANRFIYIDEVSSLGSSTTYLNDIINRTNTDIQIGAAPAAGSTQRIDGRLTHVFLDYTYRDLSIEENRRFFLTADGQPASGQENIDKYVTRTFSVVSEDTTPRTGVSFNNDGTKMYVVGGSNDHLYQYSLSSPYDVSTASYDSVSYNLGSQDVNPYQVAFKSDGSKMYMVGIGSDRIYQYSLSTPFDISTVTYDSVFFGVLGWAATAVGLVFNNDGSKFYVTDNTASKVEQFSLSTPWDMSTASSDSKNFSYTSQDTQPVGGTSFNADGTKMYMAGDQTDSVYQYSLSTPYDVSTASYDSVSFYVGTDQSITQGLSFKSDGSEMYVTSPDTDTIYQYSLSTPFDISTASFSVPVGSPQQPILYLPLTDATGTNLGSGGNFTVNGSPDTSVLNYLPIIHFPMDDPTTAHVNAGSGGDMVLNGVIARSGRGPNQYNATMSELDGSVDYLANTSISGLSDGKQMTLSFTARPDANFKAGTGRIVWAANNLNAVIMRVQGLSSKWRIYVSDTPGGLFAFQVTSSRDIIVDKTVSIQVSVDLTNTSKRALVINNEVDTSATWSDYNDVNMPLSSLNKIHVGYDQSSSAYGGAVGELYLSTEFVDLQTINPFVNTDTGKPAFLGTQGEIPTGSQPLVYLPLRADGAGKNLGSVGDFTVNSGPFIGARGASEFWARSASQTKTFPSYRLEKLGGLDGISSAVTKISMVFFAKTTSVGTVNQNILAISNFAGNEEEFYMRHNGAGGYTYRSEEVPNELVATLSADHGGTNGEWEVVYMNVDLDAGTGYLRVENSSGASGVDTTLTIGTGTQSLNLSGKDAVIFSSNIGSLPHLGHIGFLYFVAGTTSASIIDLSQEANRLLFVDGLQYPTGYLDQLINEGTIPNPVIYMKFDDPSNLGLNSGTGGNFSVNGTVVAGPDVKG